MEAIVAKAHHVLLAAMLAGVIGSPVEALANERSPIPPQYLGFIGRFGAFEHAKM